MRHTLLYFDAYAWVLPNYYTASLICDISTSTPYKLYTSGYSTSLELTTLPWSSHGDRYTKGKKERERVDCLAHGMYFLQNNLIKPDLSHHCAQWCIVLDVFYSSIFTHILSPHCIMWQCSETDFRLQQPRDLGGVPSSSGPLPPPGQGWRPPPPGSSAGRGTGSVISTISSAQLRDPNVMSTLMPALPPHCSCSTSSSSRNGEEEEDLAHLYGAVSQPVFQNYSLSL